MGILTDLFLQIQIHILEPALGLQLPGGKIDKCSPICLSVHSSCHLLFQDVTVILSSEFITTGNESVISGYESDISRC